MKNYTTVRRGPGLARSRNVHRAGRLYTRRYTCFRDGTRPEVAAVELHANSSASRCATEIFDATNENQIHAVHTRTRLKRPRVSESLRERRRILTVY